MGVMTDQRSVVIARWNPNSLRESTELTALLTDYHLQTEAEKGVPVTSVDALPEKYFAEVTDPQTAFASDEVLIARHSGHAAGCLVLTTQADRGLEIKRLWTDPKYRGRQVATSLLEAARHHAVRTEAETIRLSVWEWRAGAIALYKKTGFIETSTWDDRDHLIGMVQAV